ncbi:uncharacterized protein LOC123307976 [Coccinella septempunctata]|uniref:uncharacterized protein LOC123307976 n=1 Tax=Coccinella septempunctata TaxID=41139 RepID=UPI001D07E45F|nr:uncharacterized protein LOC123307976 [Coccinella septempunctata]
MTFETENISKNEDGISNGYRKDAQKGQAKIFSAKEFVDDLLENGKKIACDNSIEEFNSDGIPKFYDADKFKRGQDFFQKHIFALFFCKFMGLIVTLSSPRILAVLIMTKMSGSMMTAYRRYVATVFHVNLWYECELTPDSKSMKSLKKVKQFHNSASLKSRGLERPPITQEDMALTQFGFIGFCIARAEFMGIHGATREELEGFLHFWKVIGAILGIQERFNLCRDSLEETEEICEELLSRAFRPFVAKKDKDFLEMTKYLTDGMWHIDPQLNFRVFLTFLFDVMKPKESLKDGQIAKSDQYFKLTFIEMLYYRFVCCITYLLRFDIVRLYYNLQHNISIWIVHRFPFLAVYAFGYRNAMVSIEDDHVKAN